MAKPISHARVKSGKILHRGIRSAAVLAVYQAFVRMKAILHTRTSYGRIYPNGLRRLYLLPSEYITIHGIAGDVVILPCVAALRSLQMGHLLRSGGMRAILRDGTYRVLTNTLGNPRHGAVVRKYGERKRGKEFESA